MTPNGFGNHTLWRARIAAALGDGHLPIELLRHAAAEGLDRFDYALVHVVTEFDALRSDPAFQRVVGPR